MDWTTKDISFNVIKVLFRQGDIDVDMKIIKDYFKEYSGLHPDLFTTGD